MSDFFGHWMRCELHLKQKTFPITDLANSLLDNFEYRKRSLFSNEVLITCVFLDPKFHQNALQQTDEQNGIAKTMILKTWDRISNLKIELPPTLSNANDNEDIFVSNC